MKKKGFTLLELLVAVTIFSVIAVALYSTFYSGIMILRRSEDVMRRHQDLRLAMEEVSRDLRNTLLTEVYRKVEESATAEEEEEPIYYFLGEGKEFTFVTLRDSFKDGRMRHEVCNVTYYFKGGETSAFMRTVKYQSNGFKEDPDRDETLISGVRDIEVLYSYEGEDEDSPPTWRNIWEEEEKLPLGVKIKLRLAGLSAMQEFTKTVYIETGSLGSMKEAALTSGESPSRTAL